MKIALIIPTLGKGGAERVVTNLSYGFAELGHEVFVITMTGEDAYQTYGKRINLNINYSSPRKTKILLNLVRCVFKLKKIFKKIKPDQVFSFMEFANICTILSRKDSCVSVRVSLEHISPTLKKISKLLYPKAKKVIAVSKALACDLEYSYKLSNVEYVYNPLDFETLNQKKTEAFQEKEEFILCAGRLDKQKNFPLVINTYAELSKKKDLKLPKLLILGEGSERSKLETLITELSMNKRITLVGNVDNPYKYMANCELFILSSLYEGFPNVLIEAMACGAVCIATDCPTGPSEIITNGANGFLVNNNEIKDLANTIRYCLLSETRMSEIKKNALEFVQQFQTEDICKQYLGIATSSIKN